jgi:lipoyl(octanoyl) transferase
MVMKIKEIEYAISNELVSYQDAIFLMEERVESISSKKKPELIWFLEHPPIYTAGTSANDSDLLKKDTFPVFNASRGGEYTYHGPGQRIVYVMLNIRERGYDIRTFVSTLEKWITDTLKDLGIDSFLIKENVGVWVNNNKTSYSEEKIASIGLRVRKGITFHGVSLNISPNLKHFKGIVSCGNKDKGTTSLKKLGVTLSTKDIDKILLKNFKSNFHLNTSITQIQS